MSEYTPTTEEIGSVYGRVHDAHGIPGQSPERRAEFRRWLAAHDAEVLRAAAVELEQSVHHLDSTNTVELSYINCTRIDARLLRDRAARVAGVPVEQGDET